MSVYLITHKPFNQPTQKGYKSILVGAHKGHIFGDVFDDEGDNISQKNAQYCELTGIYWIWKNTTDNYVGITHYRRRFTNCFGNHCVISEEDILKVLNKYDIILPFKRKMHTSIEKHYCEESGYQEDLKKVREIIKKKYPDYILTYDKVMKGNTTYFFNMMICNKKLYNQYCEWLFSILFELEKKVNLEAYTDYQKRIYGFISERLLTVWVLKNELNVFEMGVVNIEEKFSFPKNILIKLKRVIMYYSKMIKIYTK